MKKIILSMFVVLGLSACVNNPTRATNTVDITNLDLSKIHTMKKGEHCSDQGASILKAAEDAGISKIELVSEKYKNFLFFTTRCVVVYGR